MEIKTTPKLASTLNLLQSRTPGGVFIASEERGTQGTRSDRKRRAWLRRIAAETRQKPRFRGNTFAARAAPPAARCPVVALSDKVAGFWF